MRNRKLSLGKGIAIALSAVLAVSAPITAMSGIFASNSKDAEAAGSSDSRFNNNYELVDNVQDASILHCWNWSYKTIEENMQLIAECGYSAIQTSPATQPKDYAYKGEVGMEVGIPGKGGSGNWWKLYQPVSASVCDNGQTWLGTKEELTHMCEVAESYGIKVIVDVVANHVGNIKGWQNSLEDVSPQVGEFLHPDFLTDESLYHINDLQIWMSDGREHFTQGTMGMPDLNTANKRVQKYIADYLVELIDCGVDGFRFDAAKHIETPDDAPAFASDFWPTVLNEAESHYAAVTGDDLYVYGEILNTVGLGFNIEAYTKYMSVTDNSAGNHLLDAYRNFNHGSLNLNYAADKTVLWAESHDTYMNESSRYGSDMSIVRAWSMVANKDNTASLFFVRPYYSSETLTDDRDGSFRGDLETTLTPAIMGECETYTWASNEVAAINHFNNRFVDCADNMGNDGSVAYCVRGNGIILVNFNGPGNIDMSSHGVADGTYTDEVSGNTFTVSGGRIKGNIASEWGIAVVYQNVMPNPGHDYSVQVGASVGDGTEFYTESLEVTLTAKYAENAEYTVSTGERGTFTTSKTINVGSDLKDGESLTITILGYNGTTSDEATYTYIKRERSLTNCIYFKNTSDWGNVTAYMWNEDGASVVNNANWPGEAMFELDAENDIFAVAVDADANYNKIIFSNNGQSQTKDLAMGKLGQCYDMTTGAWTNYGSDTPDDPIIYETPVISASVESMTITEDSLNVTFDFKNVQSGTVTVNGVEEGFSDKKSGSYSVTKTFTEDTTVVINAVNGDKTAAKTYTYKFIKNVVEPTAFYFDVEACGWFGNDNAVAAYRCDSDDEFIKCEAVTVGLESYYKAQVPEGAASIELCRMLPSGDTYNIIKVAIDKNMNLWVANGGFNGGAWTYDILLGGGCVIPKEEITVKFVNNYSWDGTIKAYYWGSDKETIAWPGAEMTYVEKNSNGNAVYSINVPADIKGLIFTNGSSQTVDITDKLTDGAEFSISGNSNGKYSVNVR